MPKDMFWLCCQQLSKELSGLESIAINTLHSLAWSYGMHTSTILVFQATESLVDRGSSKVLRYTNLPRNWPPHPTLLIDCGCFSAQGYGSSFESYFEPDSNEERMPQTFSCTLCDLEKAMLTLPACQVIVCMRDLCWCDGTRNAQHH